MTPFIRYRTGDFATYAGDRCSACGRRQPIITEIRRHRIQELLVASDGGLINWTALNVHDDGYAHILRFQFLEDAPGRARLRLIPAPSFTGADTPRLLYALEATLDGHVHLELELVELLPLSDHGKAIYLDQRLPGLVPDAMTFENPLPPSTPRRPNTEGAPSE